MGLELQGKSNGQRPERRFGSTPEAQEDVKADRRERLEQPIVTTKNNFFLE